MSKNYYPSGKQTQQLFIVHADGTKQPVTAEELEAIQKASDPKESVKQVGAKIINGTRTAAKVGWKGTKTLYGSTFDLVHSTVTIVENSPKILGFGVLAIGKYLKSKYESS